MELPKQFLYDALGATKEEEGVVKSVTVGGVSVTYSRVISREFRLFLWLLYYVCTTLSKNSICHSVVQILTPPRCALAFRSSRQIERKRVPSGAACTIALEPHFTTCIIAMQLNLERRSALLHTHL